MPIDKNQLFLLNGTAQEMLHLHDNPFPTLRKVHNYQLPHDGGQVVSVDLVHFLYLSIYLIFEIAVHGQLDLSMI